MLGKRYFVALSLFVKLDKAPVAYISSRLRGWASCPFFIHFRDGDTNRPIGWAFVCNYSAAASAWNKDMRERNTIFALWTGDNIGPWPKMVETRPGLFSWKREPIDFSKYGQVQLTTVYPVRALTETRAAKAAWSLLLQGDQSHTEWYDALPDRHWSKLFRH